MQAVKERLCWPYFLILLNIFIWFTDHIFLFYWSYFIFYWVYFLIWWPYFTLLTIFFDLLTIFIDLVNIYFSAEYCYRKSTIEITVESFCSTCDMPSSLELDSILRLPVSRSISRGFCRKCKWKNYAIFAVNNLC